MLFLWGKEASLFLKDWNEKGMDGGKMVLGKGGRKAKRKWDSGWFLSRGGIFLKKESTVGLLNGAFFCFF